MKYSIFGSLLCFSGIISLPAKSAEHPNIIIIMSDDQGWGDLSINGNKNLSTPNIDKLATEGVIFDRFYTCAVCSPTRAELLTGRYHFRGGVYHTSTGGERLNLDETTIAEYFKSAGYSTAIYGKWHNGTQPPYHPNTRGFDDFYGFCSGNWGDYFSPVLEHNGKLTKGDGYLIDDFTNHGIDFISKNRSNPFFLFLSYNSPHSPMQVPDRWWDKFKDKELEMFHYNIEEEDIPFTRAALAMSENIDWNVGRITEHIEKLGLSKKTIFIYLSDNGPNSWRWNGGMKGRKASVDEGGVRVPMFLKWDGVVKPGSTIPEIAGVIDLLPTLADMSNIDIEPKKPFDGISLKPLLTDIKTKWKERYIVNHWKGKTSIRSQKYRFGQKGDLYDMEVDPSQTVDISSSNIELKRSFRNIQLEWKEIISKELPEIDSRPFTVGYPGFPYSYLPARDGIAHGEIVRSGKTANCTYFTNWTSSSDSITWNIEPLSDGEYTVSVYYTCPPEDIGSTIVLSYEDESITRKITEPFNPPLRGMENDRIERTQSYIKDFKPLEMGKMNLKKGKGTLTLKATDVPGSQVMDFRLIMLFKNGE